MQATDDSDPNDITELLRRAVEGDTAAEAEVMKALYQQLHRLARAILAGEDQLRNSVQATTLVHDAYIRLLRGSPVMLANRLHFFRLAARVMRAILVDHARRRNSLSRGGKNRTLPLDEALTVSADDCSLALRVHNALERLAQVDERQAQVVEMRFFGGLSEHEIAEALGFSDRTVKRDWSMARSWLHAELSG